MSGSQQGLLRPPTCEKKGLVQVSIVDCVAVVATQLPPQLGTLIAQRDCLARDAGPEQTESLDRDDGHSPTAAGDACAIPGRSVLRR